MEAVEGSERLRAELKAQAEMRPQSNVEVASPPQEERRTQEAAGAERGVRKPQESVEEARVEQVRRLIEAEPTRDERERAVLVGEAGLAPTELQRYREIQARWAAQTAAEKFGFRFLASAGGGVLLILLLVAMFYAR
jgi:hypothetical protein